MMKVMKLRGKMVEMGVTVKRLADELGKDRSTIYRKLDNGGNFTVEEATTIKNLLGMTNEEARSIFFE